LGKIVVAASPVAEAKEFRRKLRLLYSIILSFYVFRFRKPNLQKIETRLTGIIVNEKLMPQIH